MSVQDHSLAYFYGDWNEGAKRHVLQTIRWKEEQIDLPPRKLGEPWVVIAEASIRERSPTSHTATAGKNQ